MTHHHPARSGGQGPPDDAWPASVQAPLAWQTDLVWLGNPPSPPPAWLPAQLEPLAEEPVEGLPEGTRLGEGELYRPLYHHHNADGDWWVEDAVTGRLLAGSLTAIPQAARGRLAFLTAVALFLMFLGGSIVLALSLVFRMALETRALLDDPENASRTLPLLALIGGGLGLFWVASRMSDALPAALEEPVRRVQTGRLSWPVDERWRGLFQATGWLLALVAFFGLLAGLGGRNLLGVLASVTQAALGGWLAWRFLREGQGRSLISDGSPVDLSGPQGQVVLLALRVGLGALCGTVLANLAATVVVFPLDPLQLSMLSGEAGAIAGVLLSRPRQGGGLIAGLLVNLVADLVVGPWAALLLAAATVSLLARGSGFRRAWGFSLGLVSGRLLGKVGGLFFLGVGGMTVGEILGEQMAAAAGWQATE